MRANKRQTGNDRQRNWKQRKKHTHNSVAPLSFSFWPFIFGWKLRLILAKFKTELKSLFVFNYILFKWRPSKRRNASSARTHGYFHIYFNEEEWFSIESSFSVRIEFRFNYRNVCQSNWVIHFSCAATSERMAWTLSTSSRGQQEKHLSKWALVMSQRKLFCLRVDKNQIRLM